MEKAKIWFGENKIILLWAVVVGLAWVFLYSTALAAQDDGLPHHNHVIRLHILANDDTSAEQELKLAVRDGVWHVVDDMVAGVVNMAAARAIIKDNLCAIEEAARQIINENGSDHDVSAALLDDLNFPATSYGGIIFPRGHYAALQIAIGQGSGANWWCVMFPPMCLMDITQARVIETPERSGQLVVRPRFALAEVWQRVRN
ncbi:MAG: stage II sporulation protein R [Defluviitaleaceae bacterium]|nr:stage II sporulation protein R [Defluviitaleaceae bacterium]